MTSEKDDLLQEIPEENSGGSDSSDEVSSGTLEAVVEETFGLGANERVLLVTKGTSLKKIVEASK